MDSTKYIGMDVHKESISIAVMNDAGKIVMECVIETKAITILQFIGGLRGDLHVTFEEGTWAAWLYDLLKPHVAKLVVCDPRQNALLKEGNKSDGIDARKLGRTAPEQPTAPVYHGEHGVRTLKELVRSYLTITKDLARVMTSSEGDVPQLGHPLYRQAGLCTAPSCRVAREDQRTRSAPPSGVLLPATRCAAMRAPASAARSAGGEQEAPSLETALPDSLDRSDPGRGVAGHSADSAPVPHEAAAMDLQRCRHRDHSSADHRVCRRAAATEEEGRGSRAEQQSQSRSEKSFQGSGDRRGHQTRSLRRSSTRTWWPRACGRKWHV